VLQALGFGFVWSWCPDVMLALAAQQCAGWRPHLSTQPYRRDWNTERSSAHSAAKSHAAARIARSRCGPTDASSAKAPLASGFRPSSLQCDSGLNV
jgi:hypothetical protein